MTITPLGACRVDLSTGRVSGGGSESTLSERELELLRLLLDSPGELVTREALGGPGGSRAADMGISRLRKSLGADGARIITVRGRGYRLELSPLGLDLGWARLDLDSRRAHLRDRSVGLTAQQARLLAVLAKDPGHPVPRGRLAEAIWGHADATARLDLLLHRLRQRLELDPAQPRFVVSVRNRGVVLLDSRPATRARSILPPRVDLLGRQRELGAARELLQQERRALIHGPPGIGKSALVVAMAAAHVEAGGDCLFVDLHGVRGDDDAEGRLAAALVMSDLSDDDVVVRSLNARGRLLIVLDGALPGGLAARMVRWLDRASGVAALAGARDAAEGWGQLDLLPLEDADAQDLLERAAGREVADASPITKRLDGNPLALELVGRSLQRGTAQDLDRRLAMPLTALRRAWQATLEGLSPDEHEAVLAASLFRQWFARADLAALTGDAEPVAGLLGHSVLQEVTADHLELPHAARELLRAELRGPEGRALRQRHRARCREVLLRIVGAIPHAGGPALTELESRWPDLDPALDVGETGPIEDAPVLAALAREAAERVPRARRERWAERLAEAAQRADLPRGDRAACLQSIHALTWGEHSRSEREALLRRALAEAVRGEEPVRAASIAAELASIVAFSWSAADARALLRAHPMPAAAPAAERVRRLRHEGRLGIIDVRPREGIPRLHEAVRLAEEAGLPLLEARCRIVLGQALSVGTLGHAAEHHLRRAMALTRLHDLPEQHVRATTRLAQHLLRLGLREDASELLEQALGAAVRAGLPSLEEQCTGTLGYLLIGQGRLDEALDHLDRAQALCRAHGGGRALYVVLANRGLALALGGRAAEARGVLAEALGIIGESGGFYRTLGQSYLAIAQLLDGAGAECGATAGEAIAGLEGAEHPDAEPLTEVLGVLRGLGDGSVSREAARGFAAGWSGSAEVEGVVLGVRAGVSSR